MRITINIDRSLLRTRDAGFDESKVKRDEGGQFSAASSRLSSAPAHPGLGEKFVTPKDLGVGTFSAWEEVRAPKVNKKILAAAPVEQIEFSKIKTGQGYLNRENVEKKLRQEGPSSSDYPVVFPHGDGYALLDGNHRIAAAHLMGEKSAKFKVIR